MKPHALGRRILALLLLITGPLSAQQFGLFSYRMSDHGASIKITGYPRDTVGEVEIPSEIDGLPVTEIGDDAFADCRDLTEVRIPDTVTTLGLYAFDDCVRLKSITIPDSVTDLGFLTFNGCTGLTSVTLPNHVKSIAGLFPFCTGLTSVTIPEGVTQIGDMTFNGCTGLTSVSIPDSVTEIFPTAFSGCTSLASISIPGGVTSLRSGTFSGCTSLSRVLISNGVTSIEDGVFHDCLNLREIEVDPENPSYRSVAGVLFDKDLTTIVQYPLGKTGEYSVPAGVTRIGNHAFRSCVGLTKVTLPDSVRTLGHHAFADCNRLVLAILFGDAPVLELDSWKSERSVFENTAPEFTLFYLQSKTGFTSPSWKDLPSVELNLDPEPLIGPTSAGISFLAEVYGLTFSAETSVDLNQWTSENLTLSEVDADGRRSATIGRGDAQRYFRVSAD